MNHQQPPMQPPSPGWQHGYGVPNPYAPPAQQQYGPVPPQPGLHGGPPLASLGSRFAATCIDWGIWWVLAIVAFIPVAMLDNATGETIGESVMSVITWGLVIVQAILVTKNGQSIGKRLLKIRIVKTDNTPCGFVHGVLLRTFVPWMIMFVGMLFILGLFWPLIDPMFIFRDDRRTLHDLIASTKVVQA